MGTNTDATDVVLSQLPDDWPEMAYLILPAAVTANTTVGDSYATIFVLLVAPQSRGNISIVSSQMSDAPLINPNSLTTQPDKDLLVAGFKRLRQFVTSEAMADVIIGEEFFPGPSVQTDSQILEYIQEAYVSISHAHATCQMGQASDPLAVVDSSARVYGVQNR